MKIPCVRSKMQLLPGVKSRRHFAKPEGRLNMIPARIEQFLKTLSEPDFFIRKNRAAADEIHDLLMQYVDQALPPLR